MTIKEVIRYETSDGMLHSSMKAAELWETIVNYRKRNDDKPQEPEYNMRNETGYPSNYHPVGRD